MMKTSNTTGFSCFCLSQKEFQRKVRNNIENIWPNQRNYSCFCGLFLISCLFVCMSAWGYVHLNVGAGGSQKEVSDPLKEQKSVT